MQKRLRCRSRTDLMTRFLAHWLILLAAWTLVIKFLFPIAYDAAYGQAPGTHIYWDFWWVIHLWLAWALLRRPGHVYPLALGVSVVEIVIILGKFFLFLQAPDWTLWQTNWFINKLFVLACFIVMLGHLLIDKASGSGLWREPARTRSER
ncbi:MAG: hypothetical protein R3F54_16590 [Alphaproteobacteria bacterium]